MVQKSPSQALVEGQLGRQLTDNELQVLEQLKWFSAVNSGSDPSAHQADLDVFLELIARPQRRWSVRLALPNEFVAARSDNERLAEKLLGWLVRELKPWSFEVISSWVRLPLSREGALEWLIDESRSEAERAGGTEGSKHEDIKSPPGWDGDLGTDPRFQFFAEVDLARLSGGSQDDIPKWPYGATGLGYLEFPLDQSLVLIPFYSENGKLQRLRRFSTSLREFGHWSAAEPILFLLCGEPLPLPKWRAQFIKSSPLGEGVVAWESRDAISADEGRVSCLDRLILDVRLNTSPAEVARIYEKLRKKGREKSTAGRPLSEKMLAMVEFAYDPVRSGNTWKARMEEWNRDHAARFKHGTFSYGSRFQKICERTRIALLDAL